MRVVWQGNVYTRVDDPHEGVVWVDGAGRVIPLAVDINIHLNKLAEQSETVNEEPPVVEVQTEEEETEALKEAMGKETEPKADAQTP